MRRSHQVMFQSAARIALHHKAKALLFNWDNLDKVPDEEILPKHKDSLELVAVTQKSPEDFLSSIEERPKAERLNAIFLPKIRLTRLSHLKIAVVHALSKGIIKLGDKIVFLTGRQGSQDLDSLVYIDTATETEILTARGMVTITENTRQEVFETVLNLALELAQRGREGKPVGTTFVLGDEERVLQLSKQMIINPFRGYSEEESNILNPLLKETIREFAAIDGAFIISGDGRVLAAGRYLNAASEEDELPQGLGSRHLAASGISALTKAIAIVIAESSGDVRIFKDGKILMEIEKSPSPQES